MATTSEIGSSKVLSDYDGRGKTTLLKPTRCSLELYNKEIDEAIGRVEAGEYYTHEEVKRMAREW